MSNIEFPDTIKFKIRWRKNVLEERKSPDQIIFGSMDWTYSVLVSLTIHLEHAILERDEDASIPMFGVKQGHYLQRSQVKKALNRCFQVP